VEWRAIDTTAVHAALLAWRRIAVGVPCREHPAKGRIRVRLAGLDWPLALPGTHVGVVVGVALEAARVAGHALADVGGGELHLGRIHGHLVRVLLQGPPGK
jgi:hypothetical protein